MYFLVRFPLFFLLLIVSPFPSSLLHKNVETFETMIFQVHNKTGFQENYRIRWHKGTLDYMTNMITLAFDNNRNGFSFTHISCNKSMCLLLLIDTKVSSKVRWVTILRAATMFFWWNRSWYTYSHFFFKFCWIFLLCHWKINFDHILQFIFCPPCNCCCFQIRQSFCLFLSATESAETAWTGLETKISV